MREVGGSSPSSPIGLNHPAGWRRVAESVSEWSLPGWLGTVDGVSEAAASSPRMQPLFVECREQFVGGDRRCTALAHLDAGGDVRQPDRLLNLRAGCERGGHPRRARVAGARDIA